MKEITINEMRTIQLKILDAVHDFCTKNNLHYFLIAGTLLGAIRHGGYIPWDDDIDIAMLRKDYEVFIKTFYSDSFSVLDYRKDINYNYPYAKIQFNNTLFKEQSRLNKPIGINIDLFPIDYVPEDFKSRKNLFKFIKKYRLIYDIKDTKLSKKRSFIKNVILICGYIFFAFIKVKKICAKLNKISVSSCTTESRLCAEVVWGCGEKEVVSSNVFSSCLKCEFEDREYFIPVDYNEWLSRRYGDSYMEIPPIQNQKSHHNFKVYIL